MTCCLPRTRFIQVECHDVLACQGIDLSRLNVMPGLTRHLSLIFQTLRSTTIFFKAVKRLYHPFGVLVFCELFTFIIMPPLRGYVSTAEYCLFNHATLRFPKNQVRWNRIVAGDDLRTVQNYVTLRGYHLLGVIAFDNYNTHSGVKLAIRLDQFHMLKATWTPKGWNHFNSTVIGMSIKPRRGDIGLQSTPNWHLRRKKCL